MFRHAGLTLFAASVLGTAVLIVSGAGCQSDPGGGGTTGGDGGGSSGATTGVNTGGSTAATMSTGTDATTGTGPVNCEGPDATIHDITTNVIGPGVKVSLTGVVAMSQKFLTYKSNSTGSCLWGVFVSAPGLATTAENTGLLVVSYGFDAVTNDAGQAYCPKLGQEPAGDMIPDDVAPGDVLDFVGTTSYYVPSTCGEEPGESTIGQFQIQACSGVKTGTAAVPAAAVVDPADLSDAANKDFHDKWGGVKVRIENVTPAEAPVVGMYGIITLTEGGLLVPDEIYYRGYAQAQNKCHAGPVFADGTIFASIEGFSYRDYCTWVLEPNDKCADFDPPSEDCNGAPTCPPG
jgi:hypothetical protein